MLHNYHAESGFFLHYLTEDNTVEVILLYGHVFLLSQSVFLDKICFLFLPFILGNSVDPVDVNFHSQRA